MTHRTDHLVEDLKAATAIAVILAGLFVVLCLTGCASTSGAAGGYIDAAADAGYDTGLGAFVDIESASGVVRPRFAARAAYQPKDNADTGYTYSGRVGLQWRPFAERGIVEAGMFAAGYESTFASGAVWKKDLTDWYARLGWDAGSWLIAATHHPPSNDQWESYDVQADFRLRFGGGWTFIVQPGVFRYVHPVTGEHDRGNTLLLGYGRSW